MGCCKGTGLSPGYPLPTCLYSHTNFHQDDLDHVVARRDQTIANATLLDLQNCELNKTFSYVKYLVSRILS